MPALCANAVRVPTYTLSSARSAITVSPNLIPLPSELHGGRQDRFAGDFSMTIRAYPFTCCSLHLIKIRPAAVLSDKHGGNYDTWALRGPFCSCRRPC